MSCSSKRALNKSCLAFFLLDDFLSWLPRVAFQVSPVSLLSITLNILQVLLDSGNSLTCNSSAPCKPLWKSSILFVSCFFFLSFEHCYSSLVCSTLLKPSTHTVSTKGCVGQWCYSRGSGARYLISTHSLKVIRYHLSPRAQLSLAVQIKAYPSGYTDTEMGMYSISIYASVYAPFVES